MHPSRQRICGSVYVKLNQPQAIKELISMLTKAKEMQRTHKAKGIILTGDLNARHIAWGDKVSDEYGRSLIELLDNNCFGIHAANSPTFLCTNGSSCIDLVIASNDLMDNIESCTTDNDIELYSGAPFRGHLPLITNIKTNSNTS